MHNAVYGAFDDIHNSGFKIPDGTQSCGSIALSVKVYHECAKSLGESGRCQPEGDRSFANAPFEGANA